jgi:hypothetical protein
MKRVPIHDPAHWRQRAEECRKAAEKLEDPDAKATLLEICRSYEKLADLAARQAKPDVAS